MSAYSGVDFPYRAYSPLRSKKIIFNNINDIYDEIINIYEQSLSEGFSLGESLYKSTLFFSDHDLLLDQSMQNRIKEFQYCKQFSCPPYPSLNQTPVNIIDDFCIIEREVNSFNIKAQQEKRNA